MIRIVSVLACSSLLLLALACGGSTPTADESTLPTAGSAAADERIAEDDDAIANHDFESGTLEKEGFVISDENQKKDAAEGGDQSPDDGQ